VDITEKVFNVIGQRSMLRADRVTYIVGGVAYIWTVRRLRSRVNCYVVILSSAFSACQL